MPFTTDAFAEKIKNKYPQYKNVDNLELSKRIVEKYPEYQGQVIFEDNALGGFSPEQQEQVKSNLQKAKGFGTEFQTAEEAIGQIPPEQREQTLQNLSQQKTSPKIPGVGETLSKLPASPIDIAREKAAAEGKGFLGTAGEVAKETVKSIGKGTVGAVAGIPQATGEVIDIASRGAELLQPIGETGLIDVIKGLVKGEGIPERGAITRQTEKLAEVGKNISDFLIEQSGLDPDDAAVQAGKILSPIVPVAKAAKVGSKVASKTLTSAKKGVKSFIEEEGKKISEVGKQVIMEGENKAVESIAEKISPKFLKNEKLKAKRQGRVERINGFRKFVGLGRDVVQLDNELKEGARVVLKKIDGSKKMNEFQLKDAAEKKIVEIAESLKEPLSNIKLKSKEKNIMRDKWKKIKENQSKKIGTEPRLLKDLQEKFDKDLERFILGGTKNAKQAWSKRILFDDSIDASIKKADLSNLALDSKARKIKEFWLDAREVYNDMIKGVGVSYKGSKKIKNEFSDMNKLYNVVNSIVQNVDVEPVRRLRDVFKDKTKKLGKLGIGAVIGIGAAQAID